MPVGAQVGAAPAQANGGAYGCPMSMYSPFALDAPKPPVTSELLFSYEGEGMLFARGARPPFAVYTAELASKASGVKIDISYFNMDYEIVTDTHNIFTVVLKPSQKVLQTAAVSHSCVHPKEETSLQVHILDAFDGPKVEVDDDENKRLLSITLPKKELKAFKVRVNKR